MRLDDSVIRVWNGADFPIRRRADSCAAGLAEKAAKQKCPGLGPELKNTICLSRGDVLHLSHHIVI